MIEIERKFLVNSLAFKAESHRNFRITQGFLNTHKERTVRVRVKGDKGYLTIKGVSSENGLSRFEWEKEIHINEAEALLKMVEPGMISKCRFEVSYKGFLFEVDEFYEDNSGLIIAEVELTSETVEFQKPEWLGEEVTGDKRYYNSQLSLNPYKNWK
ncbi:MAG: adenylate cyclase [Bacteroidetes bacterium MedPE-SWsnd-G2]|nr:MAG: adenylate cyclase [Bacteroidetes bacterium MedPE-SWsnd-G2]